MITENLSTLKIHKLTQAQYDRELANGNIDETALYLIPEDTTANTFYVIIDITNTSSWEYSDSLYKKNISVSGILESDEPTIGVYYESNDPEHNIIRAYNTAFNYIDAIITHDGYITVYTSSLEHNVDFSIQIKVVR